MLGSGVLHFGCLANKIRYNRCVVICSLSLSLEHFLSLTAGVGHFVHFSTAMGMAGDGGIIKTRRMTPHRDFQCLEFFYYYNGADSDQLNIWLREFESGSDTIGASTLVGQITGEGTIYQLQSTVNVRLKYYFLGNMCSFKM